MAVSAVWAATPARAAVMVVLGLSLLAAATVDLKTQRLPDRLTVLIALAGGLLAASSGWPRLLAGLAEGAGAAALLSSLRWLNQKRDGESRLGFGDVKLVAALALWLGLATPVMVAGAAGLGLAAAPFIRATDGRRPFGPLIAAAGWIVGVAVERGWQPWAP
jgi:leader peptidase (prepilin peptidase)/N-methyltransferase